MDLHQLAEEALRLLLSVGLSAGTALAVLKFGGENLLKYQFDKALEGVKADQARALAQQNFDISASLDRTATLHKFEFEVLPEAWAKLHVAGGSCGEATKSMISRTGVATLTDAQLEIVLKDLEIPEIDSRAISALSGDPRQELFDRAMDHRRWNLARRDQAELNNYLLSHGIFIQKGSLEKFKSISRLINEALSEYGHFLTYPTLPHAFKARDTFHARWSEMTRELEAEVHARLWNSRLTTIDQQTTPQKP